MITKLLIGLGLFAFYVSSSLSQNVIVLTNSDAQILASVRQAFTNAGNPSHFQSVTNWGSSNCGCQLSAKLDANVIKAGSGFILHFWIKNSSTNNVRLNPSPSSLMLTNNLGKAYRLDALNPATANSVTSHRMDANPGEFIEGELVIFRLSRDLEPSVYVIEPFTRTIIGADGKTCILTSNPLEIEVISGK